MMMGQASDGAMYTRQKHDGLSSLDGIIMRSSSMSVFVHLDLWSTFNAHSPVILVVFNIFTPRMNVQVGKTKCYLLI